LQSIQDSLQAQKALTAATGKAAARALIEVRDVLRMHRVAQVSARLVAEFDWRAIPVRVQDLARVHQSVLALDGLGVSQLFYETQHDDGYVIGAVRHLANHWNELKQLVEQEDLELSIAPVQVPAIAKPKPAVTTVNQHGTLSAAAA
jgi:hypothetical protein